MPEKEIYTVLLDSYSTSANVIATNTLNVQFNNIMWQSILPQKYTKFKVRFRFLSANASSASQQQNMTISINFNSSNSYVMNQDNQNTTICGYIENRVQDKSFSNVQNTAQVFSFDMLNNNSDFFMINYPSNSNIIVKLTPFDNSTSNITKYKLLLYFTPFE